MVIVGMDEAPTPDPLFFVGWVERSATHNSSELFTQAQTSTAAILDPLLSIVAGF